MFWKIGDNKYLWEIHNLQYKKCRYEICEIRNGIVKVLERIDNEKAMEILEKIKK